ncbi:MAG: DUF5110 domain-containing protein [Clostridia bacterium]|nr:DUF5110 domain-containing protein [Clostridia bacterium]
MRRFQLSALSPMLMLNAWASGAKPWKFPEVEPIIADTIRLRRALLPYLYNAFHAYQARGIPPFRPLAMDYSAFSAAGMEKNGRVDDTQNPYGLPDIAEVVDQYMIGDCLMAAPMQPGQSQRSVLLPPGRWYDAWTARPVAGPVLDWECPLDRIPLFVREGGMIPLLREDGTLEVRCYGPEGRCDLYDDDGETFAFERGEYAMLWLSFTRENGALRGRCEIESHGWQPAYTKIRFV